MSGSAPEHANRRQDQLRTLRRPGEWRSGSITASLSLLIANLCRYGASAGPPLL